MFVFLDEHPDGINDGWFATDPDNQKGINTIVDYPASYHGNAGGLAFADGHSEIHRWRDPDTMPPLTTDLSRKSDPNNVDIFWLQQHSSQQHD